MQQSFGTEVDFEPNSSSSQNSKYKNHFIKILNVFDYFHNALLGEIIIVLFIHKNKIK